MADFNPWSSDEDDEAEVFQDEEDLHDHKIVLVDCRPCMFVPNPHDEEAEASSDSTYFTSVMDIVLDMFKEVIISRPKDKLALVFFGTRDRRHTEFDHVWVAQKLKHPEADAIKHVQAMRDWGVAEFERAVGSLRANDRTLPSGAAVLKSAIWQCNVAFNNDSKRTADENIWIFTNDDDPCHAGAGTDARDREVELLREQAKEAAEVNRKITLVPMAAPPPAADFDLGKVYEPALLAQHCAADKGARASHIALKSATRRKHVRKRTTASLPFVVHGGARFRVRTYKVLQRAKRPAAVDVDAHDSTVLLKTSTPMCEATGANLEPAQIKTYVPYAQQRVYVRRADVAAAKDIGERGIVLLGFERESELRDYSMDSSVFVYPDERAVAGSTAAFAALHAAMRREDREGGRRFALVAFRPREASAPQLAALVATPNQGSIGGGGSGGGGGGGSSSEALLPGGMHLIKLPYRNEIRDLSRAVGPHHAFLATNAERRAALARAEAEAEAAAAAGGGGDGCEELGEEARAAAVARAGWRPDDATVAAARKVLVCRMPSYDPSIFPNPSLNKFYAHLQVRPPAVY
jgi:ATP-dependent DNA helicase 2 subunit 1